MPQPRAASRAAEPRRMRLTGLHHLTAICADLERTTAFYRDVLGLALVREGANDDDPDARHFWFGAAATARPGTLISFLEYPQLGAGGPGDRLVQHFAFAVGSAEELEAWRDYLRARGVPTHRGLRARRLRSIYLRDPDGHIVEIATRRRA